jgi:DNA repair exonuclease SbcCD ATPase subunit
MSRLEFTRLILRDFKEYRGKHALDLAQLGNGLHYVRGVNKVDQLGSNGAGKSTLWDAFMWALTGRTVRGLRGVDVQTWDGHGPAVSRVDFYIEDRSHYVKRSTVKNGLWLDGKMCSQEEIDRLLGLSLVNIPHTIILGQKQDLFFDLKPQAKLEVLSETLMLDKWDERSKRARDKVKDIEAKLQSLRASIALLERDRDASRDQIEELKEKAADWEKERFQSDDKLDRERERLTKALTSATAEQGPLDLAYDSAETELRAARKDLMKKSAERNTIVDALAAAKIKAAQRAKERDDLKELAQSDLCPTCGQSIENHRHHAADAKSKLKDAKHKAALASDAVIVRETQLELHDKGMQRVRKSIDDFGDKSNKAKDGLDHLTARIADIKQQIAVLKAQSREHEVNPFSEALSRARAQVKKAKGLIAEAQELADKADRQLVRTRYWVDGFKQVRLYLLQETLEELQEVTQNMLPSLGLTGWVVQYDIERDTKAGGVSTGLTVTILKPGMSKGVRWEAWSGGEGQRLLIVGAMALSEVLLRRAGIECDMLVLDEPTRHMSKEGIAETVDYLIERGRDGQVFYVDHQVVESNRFASVITVEKTNEGAQIKVEA